ncbi:uncharacterized protein VICG_01964 [Vittaforma corneae ATCC 50505]|uniref:Trafficking protein particle complex subunit n=1 Tax=Vittaforma corneae (strain ATCC 50505) TaxID=993615 RepID=L2GKG8_VITCO|nr:uncharacterized protein VICG_01964 [Vittaforma corneae ATCC 50505]ELA41005.1 hypothetical protein VICG_01964 [Vittaforma corneae ATCC 50505]
MKSLFTKYFICGLFKYLQKGDGGKLEQQLSFLGRDIGQRIALLTRFKRDRDLDSLVYRIVFVLLPCLYPADREIAKGEDPALPFYIHESSPAFEDFDYQDPSFCASAVVAGIIEMVLEISGFEFQVLAYNCQNGDEKKKVVYTIGIKTSRNA